MKIRNHQIILTFVFLLIFSAPAFSQTERDKGIELYQKGDYEGAVKILKSVSKGNPADIQVWIYLGISYVKRNAAKEAINAFNKAIELDSKNSQAHTGLAYALMIKGNAEQLRAEAEKALELNSRDSEALYILGVIHFRDGLYNAAYDQAKEAISINPKLANAFLLKSQALTSSFALQTGTVVKAESSRSELLKEAVADLETYLNLSANSSDADFYRQYLDSLKFFEQYYQIKTDDKSSKSSNSGNQQNTNTIPLKIISKPIASYTNQARDAVVSGIVRLLVGFSDDGKLIHVLTIKSLGYGLDEEAIKAAHRMRFQPAMKDGKPVSIVKIVEYTFSIGEKPY